MVLTTMFHSPHTVNASAKSEVGFDRPEPGGWPPYLSGFFTSVIAPLVLWAVCFGEGLRPADLVRSVNPVTSCPPALKPGGGYHKPLKQRSNKP